MIALEGQILIAFLADAVIGDPRWLPHPVRGIGWLAGQSERLYRWLLTVPAPSIAAASSKASMSPSQPERNWRVARAYIAGGLAVATMLAVPCGLAVLALATASEIHPLASDMLSIYIIYSCIALRDLCVHARRVHRALMTQTLSEAQRCVSMIVGRDTGRLDASGVAKATVESVAESFVDGVTAPLLYAALLGPMGALAYRVINTLDSMFGYRNERYRRFGWVAAKLDDCANYVPARLSAPLLAMAAGVSGASARSAWRILLRDGRNHASPNAGLPEAAMAGALHLQLGGTSYYSGTAVAKPTIGDGHRLANAQDIRRASRIIAVASVFFLISMLSARLALRSTLAGQPEPHARNRLIKHSIAEDSP